MRLSVSLSLVSYLSLRVRRSHASIVDGKWLIQRGGINSAWLNDQVEIANGSMNFNPNFLHIENDITLEDARDWCVASEDCVAFSFNIKSRKSMRTIDSVFFLFEVENASRGDFSTRPWFSDTAPGWVTHVLNDQEGEWPVDTKKCHSNIAQKEERKEDPEMSEENMKPELNKERHKEEPELSEEKREEETELTEEDKRDELDEEEEGEWWDEEATLWNEEVHKYDKDASPYQHCCHHANDKEWVPSIETIREMDSIQRISCDISREEFVEKYESKRIPVILEGCDKDWPAKENLKDFETLIPRFHNDTIWNKCGWEMIPWSQVQEHIVNNSLCIFHKLKTKKDQQIRQDYTVPRPFRNADIFRHLVDVENTSGRSTHYPMAFLSLRTKHVLSHLHQDCFHPSIDSWNTIFKGHYWWVVFPDTKILSHTHAGSCRPECSTANDTFSWFATVGFNAHKHVFEDGNRPLHILQGPGDTVYIPDRWMHALMALDDENIAVTQGYASEDTNFEHVWKEVLAWGDEDDWTKLYDDVFTEDQRKRAREAIKGDIVCVSNSMDSCIGEETYCDYSSFFERKVKENGSEA